MANLLDLLQHMYNNGTSYAYSDNTVTDLYGASDTSSSSLKLYGKDQAEAGGFKLISNNGESSHSLVGTSLGNLSWTGSFSADKVYNAVFNDYAEFFEKGEETEDGDIIGLIGDEKYGKGSLSSLAIIGVRSDNPAMIVGGKKGLSPEEQNEYIPVALAGRIYVKVSEKPQLGDYIDVSEIPGVGVPSKVRTSNSIGIVVSVKDYEKTKKARVFVI